MEAGTTSGALAQTQAIQKRIAALEKEIAELEKREQELTAELEKAGDLHDGRAGDADQPRVDGSPRPPG